MSLSSRYILVFYGFQEQGERIPTLPGQGFVIRVLRKKSLFFKFTSKIESR